MFTQKKLAIEIDLVTGIDFQLQEYLYFTSEKFGELRTMTDSDGRYRLDDIPPGTYTVVAWHEGDSSEPAAVTVPSGGVAELDIPVR